MEKSKLTFKVETDQFVICLVLPECLLSKFVSFHPGIVKRIVMALMPTLIFRCFSLFLSHLRTLAQEKVGKLSSLWDKWAQSLFVFIIVAKYSIFPHADNGHSREKKKFW